MKYPTFYSQVEFNYKIQNDTLSLSQKCMKYNKIRNIWNYIYFINNKLCQRNAYIFHVN